MGLREKRLLIAAAFHFAVLTVGAFGLFLGIILNFQPLLDAGGMLILLHLLTFQRIPLVQRLQERLLRTHRCSCGFEIDLAFSAWRCGCGFVSPERHVLTTPCPNCSKGFAYIHCPRCHRSIHI